MKHIIDTDKDPILPEWATPVSHKKMGQIEWKEKDFELYLDKKQKGGWINGNDLYEKIKDTPVMNVNVAQFFVDNPKLYPKEWKNEYVYFWGTIVRDRRDNLRYVPYLYGRGDGVVLDWVWAGHVWFGDLPALRHASSSKLSELSSSTLPLDLAIKICKDNNLKIYKEL